MCLRAIRPPYKGKPPYSLQDMSAIPQSRQAKAISTVLCRDTALYRVTAILGDPYCSRFPHVVLWRTHREGGSVARVSTERGRGPLVTSGDLDLLCNEAVLSRGRGPGAHIGTLDKYRCWL